MVCSYVHSVCFLAYMFHHTEIYAHEGKKCEALFHAISAETNTVTGNSMHLGIYPEELIFSQIDQLV